MTETNELTHHQRTLMLWEAMGTEPAITGYDGVERRKRPRFLVSDAVCRLDVIGGDRERTMEVTVRDVNATGACLLCSRALPVRETVKLHPPTNTRQELDAVDARVTYCRKTSQRYRVGVKFYGCE